MTHTMLGHHHSSAQCASAAHMHAAGNTTQSLFLHIHALESGEGATTICDLQYPIATVTDSTPHSFVCVLLVCTSFLRRKFTALSWLPLAISLHFLARAPGGVWPCLAELRTFLKSCLTAAYSSECAGHPVWRVGQIIGGKGGILALRPHCTHTARYF